MYAVAVAARFAFPEKICNIVLGETVTSCRSFRAAEVRTKSWRLSAVTRALGLTISFSSLMLAAGIPELYNFDDQLQDVFAWRFWVLLAFLIVMTGRQLKRDVFTICKWMVPASVVTRPWPLVNDPPEVAACVIEESKELHASVSFGSNYQLEHCTYAAANGADLSQSTRREVPLQQTMLWAVARRGIRHQSQNPVQVL
jgi:hypothetical protein